MQPPDHARPAPAGPAAVTVHRPARLFPEPVPGDPIVVAAPPSPPPAQRGGPLQLLVSATGGLGLLGFALLGGASRFLAVALAMAGLGVAVSVALWVTRRRAQARLAHERARRYTDHLGSARRRCEQVAAAQRRALAWLHPDPGRLVSLAGGRQRVWERRRDDADFLRLRLGLGDVPMAAPVTLDGGGPLAEHDGTLLAAALALVGAYQALPSAPVAVDAAGLGWVALLGGGDRARSLARALVCQLAALHAPADLRLVAWFPAGAAEAWRWLHHLPHLGDAGSAAVGGGAAAGVATSAADLEVLLARIVRPRLEDLERRTAGGERAPLAPFPRVVVLLDGYDPDGPLGELPVLDDLLDHAAAVGVLVLALVDSPIRVPGRVGARLQLDTGGGLELVPAHPAARRIRVARADGAPVRLCAALAGELAPLRQRHRRGRLAGVDSEGLLGLLGIGPREQLDLAERRSSRPPRELLAAPVGVQDDGGPLLLDLKEAADGGMGPHGLVVGATGSGKSELLRTLAAGLAARHAPEELALVLVDYKGGATFAGLAELPHVAGLITNLECDPSLVERARAALSGELRRRQRLLADARLERAADWRARRRDQPEAGLEPMPALLVVVDEFGELLDARPDFLELFVSIGRTGRSLGVHLLLATQRLDGGRIRGLESHLRYRACLRTFSAEESMLALGTRAAFELAPLPGLGLLAVDGGVQRFKAALATRPARAAAAPGARPGAGPGRPATELEVVVEAAGRAWGGAGRAREVWLPPLPPALTLDQLLGPAPPAARPGEPGWLRLPVGLLDRPEEQSQPPLVLDLAGADGHVAVVGAPRSGKSTLLQAFLAGLVLTHDPGDVQVYAVDLGGGGLHAFAGAPHVGAVHGRGDREPVARLVRELQALLTERAAALRRLDGMAAYHRARAAGRLPGGRHGEVLVLVDDWGRFAAEFPDLAEALAEIAASGLHHGVHLVVSGSRWNDLRPSLRDAIGGRLELRLNDPVESALDRHAAAALAPGPAGRGLTRSGGQFQAALPRADGRPDAAGLAVGVERLLESAAGRWRGRPAAPPIRMLPGQVRPDQLPDPVGDAVHGMAIGLQEYGLEPARVDLLGSDPHLLVLGDAECGKTALLQGLLGRLVACHPPERLRIALVDPRRQLLDAVPGAYREGLAVTGSGAAALAERLAAELSGRLEHAGIPVAGALDGGVWAAGAPGAADPPGAPGGAGTAGGAGAPVGADMLPPAGPDAPELVLVVDDYDLLAGPGSSPLADLAELLAHARDVSFHAVVARRVSGLARSSFEPFLQRLRELGTPVLVLSGASEEGPVAGRVRAEPLPPGRGRLVRRHRTTLVQALRGTPAAQDLHDPPGG